MAALNPYTIDTDEQEIRNYFFDQPWTVDTINDQLPDGKQIDEIRDGCQCPDAGKRVGQREDYDPHKVHRGDKWGLKVCASCGGAWGWHDVRADYL